MIQKDLAACRVGNSPLEQRVAGLPCGQVVAVWGFPGPAQCSSARVLASGDLPEGAGVRYKYPHVGYQLPPAEEGG